MTVAVSIMILTWVLSRGLMLSMGMIMRPTGVGVMMLFIMIVRLVRMCHCSLLYIEDGFLPFV
jgi:hypothetical protein